MPTLEQAEKFLFEKIRPKAQEIDQCLDSLKMALQKMAEGGFLGLRVPARYAGSGLDDREFRRFQETCARCSGALAFLQTQHQSGCGFISQSENEQLKDEMLPKLARGEATTGIAFSQLRRTGPPILTAKLAEDGYSFSGEAPWISGWGIFDHCVTAAALPGGESVWAIHPIPAPGSLIPTQPMSLASLEVVQTVSATFADLRVPRERVLYLRPEGWIHDSDQLNLALQSPFALGCAQAALDLMEDAYERKPIPAILDARLNLQNALDLCRDEAYAAMENREDFDRSLRARASAIALMGRCAHAAVIASSGAGNSLMHPAQRIYREAIVFSVSAQTEPILTASLGELTGSPAYSSNL